MRSIEDLVPEVTAATLDGRLRWRKTDGFLPDAYWTTIQNFSILTYTWTTPDGEHSGYTVSLVRGVPNYPIDELDTVADDEFGPKYSSVRTLYTAARRSALNVDVVVGELEAYLESLPRVEN